MSNFIKDLDDLYKKESKENGIKFKDKSFSCNIPFEVQLYGKKSEKYIIRKKRKLTRFLFVEKGCRVYFSDVDILMMLLQLQERKTMDTLIEHLIKAYQGEVEKYFITICSTNYEVEGILKVEDEQVFTNPQDIDISFNELLILINLVLSKDRASNPLWPKQVDFFKHTVSKYIALIKHYYYGDIKARDYLLNMGYNVNEDIYSNYNTQQKRDEKRGFFSDFEVFEKSGLL